MYLIFFSWTYTRKMSLKSPVFVQILSFCKKKDKTCGKTVEIIKNKWPVYDINKNVKCLDLGFLYLYCIIVPLQ